MAEGPRLKRYEQSFDLTIGQQLRVDIPLQRLATASLALAYETKPAGLAVALDGKPLSVEQLEVRHYVDIGKHKVRATAPGYADFVWSRSLIDGENRTITVSLSLATGTPKWVFFTVASTSLAAAAVGTSFGLKAQNSANGEQQKPIAQRDPTVRDAIRNDVTVSTVAFSVAGAMGLTALILGFTTRWRKDGPEVPKRMALYGTPVFAPQQAGILLTTKF